MDDRVSLVQVRILVPKMGLKHLFPLVPSSDPHTVLWYAVSATLEIDQRNMINHYIVLLTYHFRSHIALPNEVSAWRSDLSKA